MKRIGNNCNKCGSTIVQVPDQNGGDEDYCISCDYVMLPKWMRDRVDTLTKDSNLIKNKSNSVKRKPVNTSDTLVNMWHDFSSRSR